jgi:predicted RNA-binding protein (virulence factor B family)
MPEIGKSTQLEVLRAVPMGLILGAPEDEVLLPKRYVPAGTAPGDFLDVFIYTDSEDRPIATTEVPLAQADEFAFLRVVEVNRVGAFLDWGLPKDLLLPFRYQLHALRPGDEVMVRVLFDRVSGRPVATAKVERFLGQAPEGLRAGQPVEMLIYEESDLGSKAIVDGAFGGLLYTDSGGQRPKVGSSLSGFIQRVRPDGKIDLSTAPSGQARIEDARDTLLDALQASGGRLEVGDRSEPDEIRRVLGLSKKAFKRAAGALYRERRIRIAETSIELAESQGAEADAPQKGD